MAKVKSILGSLSGTLGENVYVRRRGKDYVRKKAKPGSKRNEPALKQHYTRTAKLNRLASAINDIIDKESDGNKHGEFYFQLLKRFRKTPSNNRFLLLSSLKGMDIHPLYTLDSLGGDQQMIVKTNNQNFNVTLNVKYHPKQTHRVNCYCYQLLLLTWNKTGKQPTYSRQFSEWINPENPESEFDFSFKRKAGVVHWLLCLMQQMGFDSKSVSLKLQGMRIMEVGTFNKKDETLLKKIAGEQKKKISSSVRKEDEIVRVKARVSRVVSRG